MSDMEDPDKLLTPAEVARRLGVSPITVRSWVAKGWLASRATPGGHSRFRWGDVERLLAEKRHAPTAAATAPDGARILVVDDDPQFRAYLADALATLLPRAAIRQASDGFQAGMAMAELRPALVLLDYAMPGMSGAAVCRLIKSNAAYSQTRVVAVTGYADAGIQASLLDAGADMVLLKPIPLATLEAMLDRFHPPVAA